MSESGRTNSDVRAHVVQCLELELLANSSGQLEDAFSSHNYKIYSPET